MVKYMDRRQRKTREAIFNAFTQLLSKKNFNKITVEEIIEIADVGRATFYAHFETKDYLLKELCAELFAHLFATEEKPNEKDRNVFACNDYGQVFLHLFKHVKNNDNNIGKLLSCNNDNLFLEYFKDGIKTLVIKHLKDFENKKPKNVLEDFWINHITTTFIETLRWWLENDMKQSPETINEYFLSVV